MASTLLFPPSTTHADTVRIPLRLIMSNQKSIRRTMENEYLDELAESMQDHGQLQPIVVRTLTQEEAGTSEPRFEVVVGERRYFAMMRAGYEEAACVVKEISSDDALIVSYTDYAQHVPLTDAEDARFLQTLYFERQLSVRDIAKKIHKSIAYVSRRISVSKDPVLQQALEEGKINQGVAQELIHAPEEMRAELVDRVQGLTSDATRQIVRNIREESGEVFSVAPPAAEEDSDAEDRAASDEKYSFLGSSGTDASKQVHHGTYDPLRRASPVKVITPPRTFGLLRQVREWFANLPVDWVPSEQEARELDEAMHLLQNVRGRRTNDAGLATAGSSS